MHTKVSVTFLVTIDGNPLAPDIDIASVEVEDHLHLPDTFTITLRDASRTAIDACGARIGSRVKISVISDADDKEATLITGDITAIEAEIHRGVSFTTLRGYDESHRLLQGRVTASYVDMTYADVAHRVAERHKLKPGDITDTSPTHDQVTQARENDWEFLWRLAREVGYEVAVADGKLHFRPRSADHTPATADLGSDDPLALVVGDNVMSLRVSVTAAEQVKEVEVRGWDHLNKEAVVAVEAPTTNSAKHSLSPDDVAGVFPGPSLVAVGVPYATDQEVGHAAKALAEEVASASTELEGRARGNVALRAGAVVPLSLAGAPFDGSYLITSTRHTYDHDDGYVTALTVSGRQDRSLLSLAGGANRSEATKWYGLVIGIVDDVNDPEQLGRVRVSLPWFDTDFVSDWCRVVYMGAGHKRGWFVPPEVSDEVLLGFEHGDMRRPYVLGGLYSRVDPPGAGADGAFDANSHAVDRRSFTSRLGHTLVFDDAAGGGGITLTGASGRVSVTLDDEHQTVRISTDGDVVVKAGKNLTMEAGATLELKANDLKMTANTKVDVGGADIAVHATGPVKINGAVVQLNC